MTRTRSWLLIRLTAPQFAWGLATALLFACSCSSSSDGGADTAGSGVGGNGSSGKSGSHAGNAGLGAGGDAGSSSGGDAGAAVGPGDAGAAGTSGNGAAGEGPSGGPATSFWSLTPDAAPLTVQFTLETAARVVQDVPITGGVIKATAKDGTTFKLTVPDDALISPETIAMTPVVIASQPFGTGPAWGVQLLPDGLTFNQPVTLVITPPVGKAPSVAQQVPFGWSGADNQVVLANPDKADSHLALKLLHFSSYAYATAMQGMSASLAGVRNRIGGSAEARITSAMAERLSSERQAQLLGTGEEGFANIAEIEALMDEYEKEVVQVRIAAAGSSCAAGRLALETALGFDRQKQLLGFGEAKLNAQLPALMDTVGAVCLDEEWALCRDQHIVQRIIPIYFGMERQAQLLGSPMFKWQAKAFDYIYRCHQYKLDVTSAGGSTCDQWTFKEEVQGQIKLKLTAPGDFSTGLTGTGSLHSTSYAMKYAQCSGVTNIVPLDPQFSVSDLSWTLKTNPTEPGKGEIKDFKLIYAPSGPTGGAPGAFGSTHVETDTCGVPPAPPQTITGFNWFTLYVVNMGSNPDTFSETEGWLFKNWVVSNGAAVLATKSVDVPYSDGDINYTAPTSLVLTHTPAQ